MNEVHAVIELKITPQRDCGFGRIAERVSRFEAVEACFLMSGGYDLLVFVKGSSTATHFMLKTYKSGGILGKLDDGRLEVS